MMDVDESSLPSLVLPKEEKPDFDEFHDGEKKYETPKRGRTRSLSKKSADKVDIKAKLERSRQSARECRARKKLRYQYLEEIISETEKAIFALRRELDTLKVWAKEMDDGRLPEQLVQYRTSCVEKKLSHPFKLQHHHHVQIEAQRQELLQQQQQAGAACLPSQNAALSLSPSGNQMSPYMTMLMGKSLSKSISPP